MVLSHALELSVNKVSFVVRSVFPRKFSLSILLSLIKISNICCSSVVPSFLAMAVLNIVQPLSYVSRLLCVCEYTDSTSFVVLPVPFINISVRVSHAAVPVCHVPSPLTLVLGAVTPELDTDPVFLLRVFAPLTLVLATLSHVHIVVNINALFLVLGMDFLG